MQQAEQTKMENGTSTITSLAQEYKVCSRTISNWLSKIRPQLNKLSSYKKGKKYRIFNSNQTKLIRKHLGPPRIKSDE